MPDPSRSAIHAAAVGADLAILDIAEDAWRCVPGGAAEADVTPAAALTPHPVRTIIHRPRPRPATADWLAGLAAMQDVRRARRQPGLAPLLALAPDRGRPGRTPAGVEAAALAFWTLQPWLPIEGECLIRSALLVSFLRRRGFAADWVFAVRLRPFSAHCWVQSGQTCLNDDVERLLAYTPVYVR